MGWLELLGRLNAKGPNFSMAPGGKPRFTPEDISAALSGMEYPIYCYARVKFTGDTHSIPVMLDEIKRKVRLLAVKKRWKGRGEYIDRLGEMAVVNSIDPHHCKKCKGRGFVIVEEKHKACIGCNGTCVRMPSSTEAAESFHPDMTPEAWRKTWSSRYGDVTSLVSMWDSVIEGQMARRLR